jgi:hypothetical protein
MDSSKIKTEKLPSQVFLKIDKREKNKDSTAKKLFDYMDVNLDKTFLNTYFQEVKKKPLL